MTPAKLSIAKQTWDPGGNAVSATARTIGASRASIDVYVGASSAAKESQHR